MTSISKTSSSKIISNIKKEPVCILGEKPTLVEIGMERDHFERLAPVSQLGEILEGHVGSTPSKSETDGFYHFDYSVYGTRSAAEAVLADVKQLVSTSGFQIGAGGDTQVYLSSAGINNLTLDIAQKIAPVVRNLDAKTEVTGLSIAKSDPQLLEKIGVKANAPGATEVAALLASASVDSLFLVKYSHVVTNPQRTDLKSGEERVLVVRCQDDSVFYLRGGASIHTM